MVRALQCVWRTPSACCRLVYCMGFHGFLYKPCTKWRVAINHQHADGTAFIVKLLNSKAWAKQALISAGGWLFWPNVM